MTIEVCRTVVIGANNMGLKCSGITPISKVGRGMILVGTGDSGYFPYYWNRKCSGPECIPS